MRYFSVFAVQCIYLFSVCSCELNVATESRILNGFIDYLNNLPNQPYVYENGNLINAENTDVNTYKIEVNLRVSDPHDGDSKKNLRCTTSVLDLGEDGISVQNNAFRCLESSPESSTADSTPTEAFTSILDDEVTESMNTAQEELEHRPIQLDNEVQPNNVVTSGEQFIAIPREQPAPCIGCSTHVSPQAVGVDELANLCVRHLDRHEPNVKHILNTVVDVERQVQAVNGVRYILTLTVDYNNCTSTQTDACAFQVPCKISVLEKPWVKLPDGSKYRAILSNNCTERWLFGDNGEVISEHSDNKENNDINVNPSNKDEGKGTSGANQEGEKNTNSGSNDETVKVVHNLDVQAQQNEEIIFTDEEIKLLQEQIIPHDQFRRPSNNNYEAIGNGGTQDADTEVIMTTHAVTDHAIPLQNEKISIESVTPKIPHEKETSSSISDDKKKAIDDMMSFFNFAGINMNSDPLEDAKHARIKRSFESDLKTMNLVETYNKLKTKLHNAKYLHELGQTMVDYLNEMDMEVKTRTLNEVIAAEEEFENNQHFFYIQARVTIPCDKAQCENKDTQIRVCNAIIDSSNQHSPQVMNVFCYDEVKRKPHLGKIENIPLDDPVLLKLANMAVKKIESEYSNPNALKIRKIFSAMTQKVSGTLTKMSVILELTNCSKLLTLPRRINCTSLEHMGTKICEVEIHERHWLKEKKITYTCTDRPADESFSSSKHITTGKAIKDSKILEIVQDALAYLEVQSNRNNKQKIVDVLSVSTQLVAGLLTKVKFVVGYTVCTNDVDVDIDTCKLLEKEPMRHCQVQVWDRPWLEEGKQVKVACNDTNEIDESSKLRKKRSPRDEFIGDIKSKQNPEYLKMAEQSLQKYIQDTGSFRHHRVIKLKKVSVVKLLQGRQTRIYFNASPTTCLVDENGRPNSSGCAVLSAAKFINCFSKIFERDGINDKEIDIKCNSKKSKIGENRDVLVSGVLEQNPHNKLYKQLAQESLTKYMLTSGSTQYYKIIQIEKVETQVVSGSLIKIDFSVSPTNCQVGVNGQPNASDCQVTNSGDNIKCHSEVWEQSWQNKKDISVNCEIEGESRKKRCILTGGEQMPNLDNPLYVQLAEESLAKYMQNSGSNQHYKLIKVEKVVTQVVSGSLTKIDFSVSPTNCQVDVNGQTTASDCQVTNSGKNIRCHSEIWEQPWRNRKEVTVNCKIEGESLKKRGVPGAEQPQNLDNPLFKQLAEESLTKYMQNSGSTQHYKLINVEKVVTQVVSGSLTKIDFSVSPTNCQVDANGQPTGSDCQVTNSGDNVKCHSEIWEQPWRNRKEVTVNCEIEGEFLKKRGVPGGEQPQNLDNPLFKQLAEESLTKYMQNSGSTQHYKLINVEKVVTQVVSGSLTKIDFSVSPTNCQVDANGQPTGSDCQVTNSGENFKCHSEIWEQPWRNRKEVTVNCEIEGEFLKKRGVPGGEQPQNLDNPLFKQLAEESLTKYMQNSGSTQHYKLINVEKVVTQVVSGSLTKIDFSVSPTNCQVDANGQPTGSDCQVTNSGDNFKCHSEIWEQPWRNRKEVTVNCEIKGESLKKRGVPGAEQPQNLDNPLFKQLAEESLTKYMQNSGSTQHYKLINVEKVVTQVVSGSLTKIDFSVSPTNCQVDANGQPTGSDCQVTNSGDNVKCHSKIWEQPWRNRKEVTVNCEIEGIFLKKRGVPGGEQPQNLENPLFKQLAEESLTKYMQNSGSTQHYKLINVEKVVTQVVSGSLTKIDFSVSPTNCQVDANGQPTGSDCQVTNSGDNFKCHSEVWEQPWRNRKEVTVNCEIEGESLKKRGVPGAEQPQNLDNPLFKQLAEESLTKYMQNSGSTQHYKLINVEKVVTQLVSGSLTKIDFSVSPTNCQVDANGQPTGSDCQVTNSGDNVKCHSKIWEQPWRNRKEVTVNCEIEGEFLKKRGVPGGEQPQNLENPLFKQLAEESLTKYMQNSGSTQHYKLINVEKVVTQVVSGSLTKIDFSVSPTNCQVDANGQPTGSDCQVTNSGDNVKCHSEIWEQPWRNRKEVTANCQIEEESRNKRGVPGGEQPQDLDNPLFKQLAEESLTKYMQNSGSTQHYKLIKLEKVVTQVVSGSLTKIDFSVSPTNCQVGVNGQPNASDCQVTNSGDNIKCHSEVWEQPWLNRKEITVNCEIERESRKKRHVWTGGEKPQNIDNPLYKQLAEESLAKYMQNSGSIQHYKLIKLEKVVTQVVSGLLTKIDFSVSPTNCQVSVNDLPNASDCQVTNSGDNIRCHSEIWEKPWLNRKEITVNCEIENNSARSKRSTVFGGVTEQNTKDPKFITLANESMQKYLLSSENKRIHQLVELEHVSTQVVSGTLTRLDFKISPTNCITGDKKSLDNCDTEDNHIIKCHAKVWERPWLKEENKIIDVSCEDLVENNNVFETRTDNDHYGYLDVNLVNYTSSLNSPDQLLRRKRGSRNTFRSGGPQEQDASKYEYKVMAEESLQKYQRLQKSTETLKVVEVNRVIKQVVSGIKYEIDYTAVPESCSSNGVKCNSNAARVVLYCHTTILDRAWIRRKDIDVICNRDMNNEIDENYNDHNERHKRSFGATEEKSVNDLRYKLLAEEATRKYLGMKNSEYAYKVTTINKVSEQVVAGFTTKISYVITQTKCLIRDKGDVEECEEQEPKVLLRCNAEIWETTLNMKDIKVGCKKIKNKSNTIEFNSRQKRDIDTVREKRQAFEEDDYVEDDLKYYYADRLMSEINRKSDSENLYKLITIHAMQRSVHMGIAMVRMYVEVGMTFCLRHGETANLDQCDEIEGMNHRLCLGRLWPSPDDELIVLQANVICDDDNNFDKVSGFSVVQLIKAALKDIEKKPEIEYKVVHQGEPSLFPSFDSQTPIKLSFVIAFTNCSKDLAIQSLKDTDFAVEGSWSNTPKNYECFIDPHRPSKTCNAYIFMEPNTRNIRKIQTKCAQPTLLRKRRSISMDATNATADDLVIQNLVEESLEKLEMQSLHRYKQRVLLINSYSSKITTGKVTTIDFDVGYTNCLKYEWVENITSCEFLEHLPRRHCVSQVYERLWLHNGRNIEVNCEDDETPLEAHIEFESAENAMQLANEALKFVEAKYPHPRRQKVVRIFTLEKQEIAGLHYRMKIEVGLTDCLALSINTNCKLVSNMGLNKFCRVNVWLRPWTDHPPNYRVTCDYQEGATAEVYHHLQAEHLFADFLVTYKPEYHNDHKEMMKRFEIFKKNVRKIHELNIYEMGTARYAVTRFADLTAEEFSARYLGLKPNLRDMNQVPMRMATIPVVQLPDKFDWRDFDAVTEVKDQGSCGSCWAFSVTGNIEGQWKMQSGQLVSLSEQELVDCDKLDNGCNGGLPDNAYRAIEQLGGLEMETDYPYEGEDDKCAFNKTLSRVQISGALNISSNETEMAKWLVVNGPISIGINANAMQFYVGGVSHPWKMLCSPTNLDHGVLIVGFGVKNYPLFHKQLPYWIVKNSWGKSWGEQGYYRVYRGDGTCGVNQMASSAVI